MLPIREINNGKISHVFFDFDDTIIRATDQLVSIWMHNLSRFQENLTGPELESAIKGRSAKAAIGELFPDWDHARRESFISALEIEEEVADYPLVSGVDQTIRHLSQAGFSLSIVTNSWTDKVVTTLDRYDLGRYFGKLITRDVASPQKPSPIPYLRAMEMNGVSEIATCVAIEDSPTGILAAKSAGLTCIGLGNEDLRRVGADFVIHNFSDLLADIE